MKLLYKGSFFESDAEDSVDSNPTTSNTKKDSDDDTWGGWLEPYTPPEDEEILNTAISRKLDPKIAIKRVDLNDKLYANVIEFIITNIGNIDSLNSIREAQQKIHDLFTEIAIDVATEYNQLRRTGKEKLSIRNDSTLRKINAMYRFFAYYIMKYDRHIVEWMESQIKAKLFNDKSDIKSINNTYSNIDISIVEDIPVSELNSASFDILERDTLFNRSLQNFFADSDSLFDSLAGGPGLFNDLTSMMVAFKYGIVAEYKTANEAGKEIKQQKMIPVSKTEEMTQLIETMMWIEASINSIITVESIREKYIKDYKMKLEKMDLTQEQITQNLNELSNAIKNGQINTVEDMNKLKSKFRDVSTSDKEKENLGKVSADMAKAYKYKIEAVLNRTRGLNNG